jgi:uncharacterized protein involved in outer membrane biogenesis
MKRKWLYRSVLVLFGILVVLFVVAAFSLGSILKRGVEKVAPAATQVDVKLKSAEVWLFAWRVQLIGFVLGNPPGYKTPSAVEVGDITVRFKPGTLLANKLVIDTIKVKAPIITLEGGLRDNNLKKIEKNLDDYVDSSSATSKPSSAAPNSSASSALPAPSERKIQVNDLLITGAKLQVNSKLSGGRTVVLSIPEIHLTDL